jgi:hypothetical protein
MLHIIKNRIGGVTVSVLAWSEAQHDRIKPKSIQMILSAKHTPLRRKGKDWLTRNQVDETEWSDMSNCKLLFQ